MHARVVIAVTLLVTLFAVPPAGAHHASWHADWDADGEGLGVGIGIGNGGSGSGGSSGNTYVWTQDTCEPGGNAHVGPSFWVIILGPDGQVVGEFCASPGGGGPPAPPTADEILNQAPLPRCEIRVNPKQKGLTGVETWLWCENVDEVTVNAGIRGYQVSAKASPQEFRWKVGDGARYVSKHPGTEQNPSATHIYETKGEYRIEVDVAWAGTFSYQGHGVSNSGSLGSVHVDSRHEYRVIESRSILQR